MVSKKEEIQIGPLLKISKFGIGKDYKKLILYALAIIFGPNAPNIPAPDVNTISQTMPWNS